MKVRTMASAFALVAGALIAAPSVSQAALQDFYTGAPAGGVRIANPQVFGDVQITGFAGGTAFTSAPYLTRRNIADDRGIGVCSTSDVSGPSSGGVCAQESWDGEVDEIDNIQSQESVRLDILNGQKFDGTFLVSSLDGPEEGRVQWYNNANVLLGSATFAVGTISAGSIATALGDTYTFLLTLSGFDSNNTAYVRFFSGDVLNTSGGNNDYLVAGAGVVPVPAALPMFLSALAGLGLIGRRKS